MTAQTATKKKRGIAWGSIFVNLVLLLIVLAWSIPTVGLLVSSFRTPLRHSDLRLVDHLAAPGVGRPSTSSSPVQKLIESA